MGEVIQFPSNLVEETNFIEDEDWEEFADLLEYFISESVANDTEPREDFGLEDLIISLDYDPLGEAYDYLDID